MKYEISFSEYLNKVYGGWYGKCLGGAAGAALEGQKTTEHVKDFSEYFNPDIPNDDLDIQVLWLEVLEQYGLNVTSDILAERWKRQCWYPFSEYGCFLRNYEMGIYPPYSGIFNNADFTEDMGCPIRSEIWGFCLPGNPILASEYARRDAILDHSGNSVWAEMYFAALESLAFFYSDIHSLLLAAEPYLKSDSRLEELVHMVSAACRDGKDWRSIRRKILQNFGDYDFSSALQNVGFLLMALLLGEEDMHKTINIALWCGYDTDCTCATAGAILGAMQGYSALDEEIKGFINDYYVLGIDVKRASNSIYRLAYDTCVVGVSISECGNDQVTVTDIPTDLVRLSFEEDTRPFLIQVDYESSCCITPGGDCTLTLSVTNRSKENFSGLLLINAPEYFETVRQTDFSVEANKTESVRLYVKCKNVSIMSQKNIINIQLVDGQDVVFENKFGICGSSLWKMYGPYFEPFVKGTYRNKPACDFEAAFNNAVSLDRNYRQLQDEGVAIACCENMLDVEKVMHFRGQMCCYLETTVICPEERDVWLQIGNNDGFSISLNEETVLKRDEIRMYSPYNNYAKAHLKKGKNNLSIKLLRRGDKLKFAFGFKKNNGKHWNDSCWCTDLEYDIS